MPKLKKHSKIHQRTFQNQNASKQIIELDTDGENSSDMPGLYHPKPMKSSHLFKKQTKPRITKRLIPQSLPQPQQSKQQPFELVSDGSMDRFMKKYTDQDDITQTEVNIRVPKRRSVKPPKNEIKTKNKMFSNLDFQRNEFQQQREQSFQKLQIEIQKKEKRETFNLQKFQKKADGFKNKLDYKDLNKDDRYQKALKDRLKSIQDGDELDIVVEVPKIFTGNKSQVEAAIFLKNQKEDHKTVELSNYVNSQLEQDETSVPKDRKLYYAELEKQMKMKKAQNITQSSIKECFKKSSLDDKDFIPNFDDRNRQGNYDEFMESQKRKPQDSNPLYFQTSKRQKPDNLSKHHQIQWQNSSKKDQHEQSKPIYIEDNTVEKYESNNETKSLLKPQQSQEISKKNPSTKDNVNKAKRYQRKHFTYKQLLQEQAELSDDEGQHAKHKDDGEESSSEDDNDLESLIDNDFQLNSRQKHDIHRHYVKIALDQEEKKYQEIRQKMEKQYLQEQQRLRRRMQEAARKNYLREKEENQKRNENKVNNANRDNSISCPSSSGTAERQKNLKKLRQLQEELGKDSKPQGQKKVSIIGPSKLSKLQQIESQIVNTHNNGMKKISRNGLRNVQIRQKNVKAKRTSK